MSDLLKQAIADAKAVRATALANAKAVLEETFAPQLESIISEKLRMEIEGDDTTPTENADPLAAPAADAATTPAAPAPDAAAPAPAAPAPAAPAPAAPAPAASPAPAAPAPAGTDPLAGQPLEELSIEETLKELEEYKLDEEDPTDPLEEGKKASSNYKTKTKGHKTVNKGQETVHATKLATKGSLKAPSSNRTASPDYTKTTAGHHTEDPQGQGNELADGGYDNDTAPLKESDSIEESTLDEILKELEEGMGMGDVEEAVGCATDENSSMEEGSNVGDLEEINLEEILSEKGKEELEEINLEEILSEKDEEGEEGEEGKKGEEDDVIKFDPDNLPPPPKDNPLIPEVISLKKELAEYRSAVIYLRDRINEVNLLNAKLLYTNKLFKQASLNNEQKLKVIESFDLTKSVREAKLVYATLAESFSFGAKKTVETAKKPVSATVKTITEGLASKPVASTKPTKAAVLTEGAEMANRFKKLAGIRS